MAKSVDLTGKKFGRLVAIEPTSEREDGKIIWKFKCDCGKTVLLNGSRVSRLQIKSCGCLLIDELEDRIVNGANDLLLSNNPYITNKSGVRGVFQKKNGKYQAYINYKNKRYVLGTFDTLELAQFARKEAEKEIWGKDLE